MRIFKAPAHALGQPCGCQPQSLFQSLQEKDVSRCSALLFCRHGEWYGQIEILSCRTKLCQWVCSLTICNLRTAFWITAWNCASRQKDRSSEVLHSNNKIVPREGGKVAPALSAVQTASRPSLPSRSPLPRPNWGICKPHRRRTVEPSSDALTASPHQIKREQVRTSEIWTI